MRASAYLGDLGGLSAHRQLVMLDLRGTGDSAAPADPASYRCDRQVADLEALREELGLERMDLLAHSAGGDLAVLYAARHPERVRSLALVATPSRALGIEITDEERREVARRRSGEPWFEGAYRAFENVWAQIATEADWAAIAPFSYGQWDAAAQQMTASSAAQRNAEAAARFAVPEAFDPPATREAVAELAAPVLMAAGELDVNPPAAVAERIAAAFPNGELTVVPGAGHCPWLDAPEALVRVLAGFFGTVRP
jgi:pimeloyl-ACP methyl ester carboxylesterase